MSKLLPLPSQDYLHEALRYDADTGKLYWKVRPVHHFPSEAICTSWNTRWAGKIALQTIARGYFTGSINNISYAAHRIIFKMLHGWEPEQIDHDDRNRQNNLEYNLKASNSSSNTKNRCKPSHNTSGITGVSWNTSTNKWRATLGRKDLGRFNSFEEAVQARIEALATANYHPKHGT